MALLSWSKRYSVGVKALDDQHAEFIGLLNDLHDAMMAGKVETAAGPLLEKVMAGATRHFAAEEELMASTQYPGLAEHRAKHQELLRQVEGFTARSQQGDSSMYFPLLLFLRDWLTGHIIQVDQQYTEWMNTHGIH
jgi:hemerythrin